MSARTYRARGVILLLVSILGVGLATIWARSLQPVASDLQRVDSLLSLLQQMRLLWEYQFVLTRQIDGSLGVAGDPGWRHGRPGDGIRGGIRCDRTGDHHWRPGP